MADWPILALNCRLQVNVIESAGGPLVLALRSLRFLSASQILFFSWKAAPLLMRPRHFDRSCAVCSQDPIGMSRHRGPEESRDAKHAYCLKASTAKVDRPCYKNA